MAYSSGGHYKVVATLHLQFTVATYRCNRKLKGSCCDFALSDIVDKETTLRGQHAMVLFLDILRALANVKQAIDQAHNLVIFFLNTTSISISTSGFNHCKVEG